MVNQNDFKLDPINTVAKYFEQEQIEFIPENVIIYLSNNELKYLRQYAIDNNIVSFKTLDEAEKAMNKAKNAKTQYWDNDKNKCVRLYPEVALNNPNRYTHIRTHLLLVNGPKKIKQKYWDKDINDYVLLYKKDIDEKRHTHWRTWKSIQKK